MTAFAAFAVLASVGIAAVTLALVVGRGHASSESDGTVVEHAGADSSATGDGGSDGGGD